MADDHFPQVEPPHHVVRLAKLQTGQIIHEDGRLFCLGDASPCKVFGSLDEALAWSRKTVQERPWIECWVYDHRQTYVSLIQHK